MISAHRDIPTGYSMPRRPQYIECMRTIEIDSPGALAEGKQARPRDARLVAAWLFAVAGMILIMIVLGGATRLTGSGLSIMEWAPLLGTLPPMSESEWHRLFGLYQQIPQYDLVNRDFGLAGFKHIFWLEWIHRLWGRLIGLVFLVPLVWFWATGRISGALRTRMAILLFIGGLQGAAGWFMVASGFLPDTTSVSPYRLVIHLGLALLLYGGIVWFGLSVLWPRPIPIGPHVVTSNGVVLGVSVRVTTAAVCLTILAGGFVAGLHAGLTYNTFPLMDGQLLPPSFADLEPLVRNLTENVTLVQFDHRLLATLTLLLAASTVVIGWSRPQPPEVRLGLLAIALATVTQYGLGVATLLFVVPIGLATVHQAGAVLLLTANLVLLHALRPRPVTKPYEQ
jgi:cytochrome c oxidase assembly protein subunit 15